MEAILTIGCLGCRDGRHDDGSVVPSSVELGTTDFRTRFETAKDEGMSGENVLGAVSEPVGRGPEWVVIQLSAGDPIGPALAKLEPTIDNYRKLAAMIAGASLFVTEEKDALQLDAAHDVVIQAWKDFVHDH